MPSHKRPLHERLKPLGSLRSSLRTAFFRFVEKIWQTDDAKKIAAGALHGLLNGHPSEAIAGFEHVKAPYPELGRRRDDRIAQRYEPVMITARFRSGSTLLWNIFHNISGVTAYYEPFNERRWFDQVSRGTRIDSSHRGVSEYWREYDGLAELANYYHEEWAYRNLFMDANFWNPRMKRFIQVLIEKAPGRPVLQFNRIDFRLPWIKHNFPRATIVHLYRNPRDQWCSSLIDPGCVPADARMSEFHAHDKFYLTRWAADLKYQFPFLDELTISHPYELFYYIWKLSYLFGTKYAHCSIPFEELVEKPEKTLTELFRTLNIDSHQVKKSKNLVRGAHIGEWRRYADDDWFKRYETVCETVLTEFLVAPVSESHSRRGC
jgi:Sulfotransferase family